MAIDLSKYGILGTTEIVYNPSYDTLFAEETKAELTGYEVGQVTELGAVNVMTGIYTGRSPKDKYIVMDKNSKDTVWWTSEGYKNDNHPMSEDVWAQVKTLAETQDAETGLCHRIYNRDPDRPKRLLMHRREITKLYARTKQDGLTLVPLSLYFKDSRVKVELGLCKGKKLYDKRDADAQRSAKREIDRTIKEKNY